MRYSLGLRVWHWLNALLIFGVLITVFLRNTFLEKRANAKIIMEKLSEFGVSISDDQAIVIAKAIRGVMWEWHIYLGIALGVLLLFRVFLNSTQKEFLPKKKLVKTLHFLFIFVLFIVVVTGVGIYYDSFLGLSENVVDIMKNIHENIFKYLLFFIPIHIVGVVIAENNEDRGIISDMVNGG